MLTVCRPCFGRPLCRPQGIGAVLKNVQMATGRTRETPLKAALKGAGARSTFVNSLAYTLCTFPFLFASREERAKKELNLVQREVFLAGVQVLR